MPFIKKKKSQTFPIIDIVLLQYGPGLPTVYININLGKISRK